MTRPFATVFAIDPDNPDIVRIAVEAVKNGYAVIPLPPHSKRPTYCTLTSLEKQAMSAPPAKGESKTKQTIRKHLCGVHHAITDPEVARRVFTKAVRTFTDPINIGIVAHPSRIITVDADTKQGVEHFLADWADKEEDDRYLGHTPTTRTPGMVDNSGQWVHKEGGHFHFTVPDGIELALGRQKIISDRGYDIRWGHSMAVVPPSTRVEGPYETTAAAIADAPTWVLAKIIEDNEGWVERTAAKAAMFGNGAIARWSTSVSWAELLLPDGWGETHSLDRCGCPIFEKPGGGTTGHKSATGHEATCGQYQNVEKHGPLHLWTDAPPPPLDEWMAANGKTMTKLQYVAAVQFGGDVDQAKKGLGIAVDPADFFEPLVDEAPADEPHVDDVPADTPRKTPHEKKIKAPSNEDFITAARMVAERNGMALNDELILKLAESGAERMFRRIADEVVDEVTSNRINWRSGWMPNHAPDYVERFLGEVVEPPASILPRSDGQYLVYRGRTNMLIGSAGAGKTWLAIRACIDILENGGRALYVDMEDQQSAWRERFKVLGFDIDTYVQSGHAVWASGSGPMPPLAEFIEYAGEFDLVVFDVINRLIIKIGGDVSSGNTEAMILFNNLFDPIANEGSAVLILDHPNKKGQRSDATLDDLAGGGGIVKMNNLSGMCIAMVPEKRFSKKDPDGRVDLFCLKDRQGGFEMKAPLGQLVVGVGMSEQGGLGLTLSVLPPGAPETEAGRIKRENEELDHKLDSIIEQIVAFLNTHEGKSAPSYVKAGMSPARQKLFDVAIMRALDKGFVVEVFNDAGKLKAYAIPGWSCGPDEHEPT